MNRKALERHFRSRGLHLGEPENSIARAGAKACNHQEGDRQRDFRLLGIPAPAGV